MITGSHNPADYNGFKICVGRDTIQDTRFRNCAWSWKKSSPKEHSKARAKVR